jgi:hypothetical protein
MSEVEQKLQQEVAELKATVEALVERIRNLTFDNDQSIHSLAARLEEYVLRSEAAGSAGVKRVDDLLRAWSGALYENFAAALKSDFSKEVAASAAAQITSDTIAESLSKGLTSKVLVTRQATRDEARGDNVLVTRPAQPHELR